MKDNLLSKWYWFIVGAIVVGEFIILFYFKENSYIGIHDNLDIHITDYQILKNNNAFFAHNVTLPFLGGISRNFLSSELSLYSLLYFLLPNIYAYLTGYFLKIVIAFCAVILLAKDILKDNYKIYEPILVICALIYGLLPLYPGFSFSFAAIPLCIYLIRRIEREAVLKNYLLLFIYPFISYFTFLGFFIICYLLLYSIYRSVRNKRISFRLFGGAIVLFLGFALFEYRLFALMLFDDTPTIRDTMFMGNDGLIQIAANIADVLINGVFHAYDFHKYLILPLCLIYFFKLNGRYLASGQRKRIISDKFNGVLAFILFNCLCYGLYTLEVFRTAVETLLPPLKGFQFTRTVFFNPFLWYLAFFIILKRLYERKFFKSANFLALAGLLIVMGTQSLYNDFYNTVYTHVWMAVKGQKSESLSYNEFYSPDLFRQIKQDLDYDGAYGVAYGLHPAVLQYNDIATLDGVLSYYYQSYKEDFRKMIAPALDKSETARVYFDEWGARAYLVSAAVDFIWNPVRTINESDRLLFINVEQFRHLGGKYLFSRISLNNADELGFSLQGKYQDNESPYTMYVYEIV